METVWNAADQREIDDRLQGILKLEPRTETMDVLMIEDVHMTPV